MRRLAVLTTLVGVALASTACTGSPAAATVGGTAITRSTLDGQLATIVDNADAACVFATVFAPAGATVVGAGQDTVTMEAATTELDDLVLSALLTRDLAAHHRAITAADLQAAKADLATQVAGAVSSASQGGTLPAACRSVAANPVLGMPPAFANTVVQFLAAQEQFRSMVGNVDISSAAVQQYYQQHQSEFRQVCLHVIASDSQAAALQVHTALAGGQSFAAAAAGPGVDTQVTPPGGQIPCELPPTITSTFGASIAGGILAATPGQLLAPAAWTDPTTGGAYWLVLQVDSLSALPLSQVTSTIREQLLSGTNTVAQSAFHSLVSRANVTIDPRYGTWGAGLGLQPPTAPPAAMVLNPSANQAAVVHRLPGTGHGSVPAPVT